MENFSTVKIFNLSGLEVANGDRPVFFVLFLITYLLIITFNLTLLITVVVERSLHEAMYIFIANLSVNGLYRTIGFYPKFLLNLVSKDSLISYEACLTQAYVIQTSVMTEVTILTVMSYDRYVAICKPLHYHNIVNVVTICKLLCYSWGLPYFAASIALILTLRVPICGSHIEKIYCDNTSILKQACISTSSNQNWANVVVTGYILHVVFIVYSYSRIVQICMQSTEGKVKFTQTCMPHLLTIIILIIATMFDFFSGWQLSKSQPITVRNVFALQNFILSPFFNPIIYGLQLQQIRKTVFKWFYKATF